MSIANYLVNLTDGLTSNGVLGSLKGGTGLTTVGSSGQAIVSDGTNWVSQTVASGAPKVSQISYTGDNTAANPTGGETVTLTGTGFAAGARVLINQTQVSVVTVVSATQITFTAPALATGSYVLYVVNTDGGTAVVVPGIQYSGVPSWTTAAGTLATVYETAAISSTVAATSDSAVTYSVFSGALPSGATLAANGTISGTSPVTASSTTYTFTIRASDAENQETDRTFNLTINPDTVTWSSPANAATLTGSPGVAYSSALSAASAAGQTVSYSADALPTGLAISGSTITGTPTTAGTSSTTLTATSAVTNRSAQVTISWTITVAADTYFPLTTLLLNSETTAVPFLADASTNNFSLTAFGDTKPSNFNPYTPGYYSNYFDGLGDYLSTANNAATNLSTGDFTVEFWLNASITQNSSNPRILSNDVWNTNAGYDIAIDGGLLNFRSGGGTGKSCTFGTSDYGIWQHFAFTRSGTSFKVFKNGVLVNTYTDSSNLTSANPTYIAKYAAGAGNEFTGYISNLRIVKGTAVYTSAFTPPTQPLTAVANTSLLTCQSNRFVDNSTNAFVITKAGDVQVSSFDPFVPDASYATYGSTYFDGTGDYLTAPITTNAIADLTFECWFYATGYGSLDYGTIIVAGAGAGIFQLQLYNAANPNRILGYVGSTSGVGNLSPTLSQPVLNRWIHLAVVRSGSTFTMYENGVSVATATNSNSMNFATATQLGATGSSYTFQGYISNLRLVIGTAVYTSNFTPPAAPLTAITNTQLLTCQTNQPHNNQTFLDNSTSALPVTRTGNTTQGSFSPYGANWSTYFNGSTDYLTLPSSSNLAFGTGDFCVEMWYYQQANAVAALFSNAVSSGGGDAQFELQIAASTFYPTVLAWATTFLTSSVASTPNAWNHIAVCRSGTTLSMFLNGTRVATTTTSNNFSSTNAFHISRQAAAAAGYINGYISNLRVVKGSSVYTPSATTITVPTQPLTAIANTQLLTCQSPNFTDNSLNSFAVTVAGTPSTQKFNPFATVTQTPNTYSTYFDGTGDYLNPTTGSTALAFGTEDFTVEMWVYPTATQPAFCGYFGTGANSGDFRIDQQTSGLTPTVNNNATIFITSSIALTLNAWNHIAVARSSTTLKMFINGVQSGSVTNSQNFLCSGNAVWIGKNPSGATYNTGYFSNVRAVKGTAIYTTNFTPPTTPLTAISGTQLLTCQDATFKDNSVNQFAITAVGDATPRRQNPFGFTTSSTQDYSTSTFGGSAYFDGTGDYLTVPQNAAFNFGTGNFTVEGWYYLTANVTSQPLLMLGTGANAGGPYNGWWLRYESQQLWFYRYDGGETNNTFAAPLALNTWHHIACARSGTNLKMFVNGVQVGSTATSSTSYNNVNSDPLVIGRCITGAGTFHLNGYVSDVRITKGTALYTSNFVPPTAPLTAVQNTTLLLSGDKAAIADKSGKVVLECVGDTKISTAVKKYGSSSMYFDGSDYLTFPASAALAPRTGDFTIELWAYHLDTSAYATYFQQGNAGGGIIIRRTDANKLQISHNSVVGVATSTANIQANQWTHIAVSRSGTTFRTFIDGVVASNLTYAGDFNDMTTHYIGTTQAIAGYYMNGYIDDLRITKGYARYTTTFTPPSSALITK